MMFGPRRRPPLKGLDKKDDLKEKPQLVRLMVYLAIGASTAYYIGYFSFFIALLIVGMPLENQRNALIILGVAGIVVLFAVLLPAVFFIGSNKRKKRKWKKAIDEIQEDEEDYESFYEENQELKRFKKGFARAYKRIVHSNLDEQRIDWKKTRALVFKGDIPVDSKCQICKLELNEKQYVMQCPVCKTLFHGEHLVKWLMENDNCPVCSEPLQVRSDILDSNA